MKKDNTLDVRRLLREAQADEGETVFDLSDRDFMGFEVPGPVTLHWRAAPVGSAMRLNLAVDAVVQGDCVRCLEPFFHTEHIERQYDMAPEELVGEYPEYPTVADGVLDLAEMAYSELVMEVSPVMVCREDCGGLCETCGQPLDRCECGELEAAKAAEEKGEEDPRWDALRGLLDDEK